MYGKSLAGPRKEHKKKIIRLLVRSLHGKILRIIVSYRKNSPNKGTDVAFD